MNERRLGIAMCYVTEHPEQHDQSTWLAVDTPCGTVACLAGWTCLLNGYVAVSAYSDAPRLGGFERTRVKLAGDPDSSWVGVAEAAAMLLDIDSGTAHGLFYGPWDLDSLWETVEEMTEGRVTRDRVA